MFLVLMTLVPLLMAIYIVKRLILPCDISLRLKMILTVFTLLFSQAAGINFVLYGTSFRTELVMILTSFCFCFIFMLFICCLLANLIGWIFGLFFPVFWIVFTAFGVCLLSMWLGTKQPSIHRLNFHAGLAQPVKIVQLTDLHIGSYFTKEWLAKVIDKVNALHPDIVFITGDIIDGSPHLLEPQLQPLTKINAPVYMVYGNHEYYYNLKQWVPVFERLGLHILENESVEANGLVIGGVGMPKADAFDFEKPDLDKTFKNTDENKVRILLSHYPEVFEDAIKYNVFLQLSGHTHGGQLFFPFNLMTKYSNKGYLKGLYQKDGKWLYVSTGTGLWGGLPMRLGTLPEIVEIILE